jgi:hypothetical protein
VPELRLRWRAEGVRDYPPLDRQRLEAGRAPGHGGQEVERRTTGLRDQCRIAHQPAGVKDGRDFAAAWNGTRWSLTDLPVSSRHFPVLSLAAHGHGGMWALGLDASNPRHAVTRLWLYSRGAWTEPPLHLGHDPILIQLATVPRTGTVWAAGATRNGSLYRGLIAINGPVPP